VLKDILSSLEKFSSDILNIFLPLEQSIITFFDSFWGRLTDWGFILLATTIAAYVAVKVDRKYRDKKRINDKKLWTDIFQETTGAVVYIFTYGLYIGFVILIGFKIIKYGMYYSPTITLLFLVVIFILWKHKKNKKNRRLIERLQKGKERKLKTNN